MIRLRRQTTRSFSNVHAVSRALSAVYGDWAHGNRADPLHELLFIICSIQTTEALYTAAFASLRRAFPTSHHLSSATEREIADAIRRGGLAAQKARAIRAIIQRLVSDFGRPTLRPLYAMSDRECEAFLISLPGAGKKTARCVMMYSLARKVFPVDSNCWRICRRLGWVRPTRPDKSCSGRDMDRVQAGVPPKLRFALHVNLVSHGREICLPDSPLCDQCCIRQFCRQLVSVRNA